MSTTTAGHALALHHDTIREVLPNGLTLLIRRDTTAPVVAIVTHVKVGYFDESDDIVGIAHVLEHMFFKGTPTRGVGDIARETKANGGYLNAHTIYDHTCYYTVLPSSSLVQGLEIQFDAYARSLIDAGELAAELEVIIQEVKRKRDNATPVTIEALYALLHDRHRIRRWRMGEEDALRTLTRDALLSFYRRWYTPSNTIISIVGDVDVEQVRREVAARHGMLPAATVPRDAGPVEQSPPGFRLRDWSGDIAQHHIAFGWRAPSALHPHAPALEVAGAALGTGRASRLYRAVRERQLASSASAWHYTAGPVGVFVVHAESPAMHAVNATTQMWREIQSARTVGFRASEITRAQRILEARSLRRLESMDGQATYLAAWEAEGGLALGATYHDRLLTVSGRDVHDAVIAALDPAQVSVVSYRPQTASPLAADTDALQQLLDAVPQSGSSVMVTPSATIAPAVTDDGAAANTAAGGARDAALPSTMRLADGGVYAGTLPSGVTVLVLPRPATPMATVGVFQRGGSLAESAAQEGLGRLVSNAMLKGTTTRSGVQIAEATEELGGSIAVSASLESQGWSLSVPVRHLAAATSLLADVVQRPLFPDDGVATERALAIAEVARIRDDMYRWPMRLAMTAAFGEHPYARSVVGTTASLPTLDTAHVQAFHSAHVRRAPTVLAVVGDVDPSETFAMLAREFAELQHVDDAPLANAPWPSTPVQLTETRDKQQTALALYFPGPARRDPARYAARVLAAIASGLGGRFFEQLRDKQSLAYTVSAFPIERRAGSVFASYIATSPERENEARDGLLREFAKLRDAAPSDVELDRARRYLIGTHAIAQQSGSAVLGEMVDSWLFGEGLSERTDLAARIEAVSANDVRDVAQRFFDPARVVEGLVRGTSR